MHQGRPGDKIILKSNGFPQPQGGVGLTGGLLDPFQEMPYGFHGYLGFPGVLKPIQGIQGVALSQFREELGEGLLVAEAFQAYHLAIFAAKTAPS